MKQELTAARLRELLHYDPETGVFIRRVSVLSIGGKSGRPCQHAGASVGTKVRPDGYVRFTVDGRAYMAHRLAWLYMTGTWPSCEIDHRDGRRSNNRFANLRDVSRSKNNQNRQAVRADSSSGLIGAFRVKGYARWKARICVGGKQIALGCFGSAIEAHQAYCAARSAASPLCMPEATAAPARWSTAARPTSGLDGS